MCCAQHTSDEKKKERRLIAKSGKIQFPPKFVDCVDLPEKWHPSIFLSNICVSYFLWGTENFFFRWCFDEKFFSRLFFFLLTINWCILLCRLANIVSNAFILLYLVGLIYICLGVSQQSTIFTFFYWNGKFETDKIGLA